ncbi:MAG: TatD family hydrolase, partial [Clostridia bacterium]|nr:TatD family hydrolase [Clostridia bacterium]
HEDTLNLLKKHKPKGVVHCFSGSAEMAKEVLKLGMYIGLGGAVTFKNARKPLEVADVVPDDRLLIETDCPYMTPVPFRGRRNDSSYIPYVAEVLAQVKGVTADEILEITRQNANTLFKTQY